MPLMELFILRRFVEDPVGCQGTTRLRRNTLLVDLSHLEHIASPLILRSGFLRPSEVGYCLIHHT